MHILMTCDAVGGVWTYTRELVSGLVRNGHRVSLVSFGEFPTDHQLSWTRDLSGMEFYPTEFPLEWQQDSSDGVKASMNYLERLITVLKPDLLHLNQYCYGAMQCCLPKIVVAHSDVLSWWREVHGAAPPETSWLLWYRDVVAEGLANADVIVAPSRWMLDTISKHYYWPSANAFVIYNGRDPSLFSPSLAKDSYVLSAGRLWDEGKQISLLLARRQSVPVRIAGSCDHPNTTYKANADYNADDNFKFLGKQSDEEMSSHYARASIYAVTSRYEPFGLAPVEAALSRCALVANDISVFRELWGDSATYCHRNDADSLADAIRNLSEDSDRRNDYAERAFKRARTRFDSRRMVSEYEALYNQLASRGVAA